MSTIICIYPLVGLARGVIIPRVSLCKIGKTEGVIIPSVDIGRLPFYMLGMHE